MTRVYLILITVSLSMTQISCTNGNGDIVNAMKESEILEQECSKGIAESCSRVGIRMAFGTWGYKKDYGEAKIFLEKGCRGDDHRGCVDLGTLYQYGRDVDKDLTKAAMLYLKACQGNVADGCYYLAVMYRNGIGVQKDTGKARLYFNKACKAGSKFSCNEVAK